MELPDDPKEAAKEVVKEARSKWQDEKFKKFRYETSKALEDAKTG